MNWFLIGIGIFLCFLIAVIVGKVMTLLAVRKVQSISKQQKVAKLDEVIQPLGFWYEEKQDIFCSRLHPWQRKAGRGVRKG